LIKPYPAIRDHMNDKLVALRPSDYLSLHGTRISIDLNLHTWIILWRHLLLVSCKTRGSVKNDRTQFQTDLILSRNFCFLPFRRNDIIAKNTSLPLLILSRHRKCVPDDETRR
jgi:hypothetical protein